MSCAVSSEEGGSFGAESTTSATLHREGGSVELKDMAPRSCMELPGSLSTPMGVRLHYKRGGVNRFTVAHYFMAGPPTSREIESQRVLFVHKTSLAINWVDG